MNYLGGPNALINAKYYFSHNPRLHHSQPNLDKGWHQNPDHTIPVDWPQKPYLIVDSKDGQIYCLKVQHAQRQRPPFALFDQKRVDIENSNSQLPHKAQCSEVAEEYEPIELGGRWVKVKLSSVFF